MDIHVVQKLNLSELVTKCVQEPAKAVTEISKQIVKTEQPGNRGPVPETLGASDAVYILSSEDEGWRAAMFGFWGRNAAGVVYLSDWFLLEDNLL